MLLNHTAIKQSCNNHTHQVCSFYLHYTIFKMYYYKMIVVYCGLSPFKLVPCSTHIYFFRSKLDPYPCVASCMFESCYDTDRIWN